MWSSIGSYKCVLTLSDTRNSSYYRFNVDVYNSPPVFANKAKPAPIKLHLKQKAEVELPSIFDPENNPVFVE